MPRNGSCAAIARRLVERHFSLELAADSMEDLKLVTTELVENAYVHGRGQIRLRLQRQGGAVRVEVLDDGRSDAIRLRRSRFTSTRHGLRLVEHVASSWGTHEGRAHVWAEVPVSI